MSNSNDDVFYMCVCQYGHSRSVALARVLHSLKVNAVACGVATAGKRTIELLASNSIAVLLLDEALRGLLYQSTDYFADAGARLKVISFHVGPDKWVNPYHEELNKMLRSMVEMRLKCWRCGNYRPLENNLCAHCKTHVDYIQQHGGQR